MLIYSLRISSSSSSSLANASCNLLILSRFCWYRLSCLSNCASVSTTGATASSDSTTSTRGRTRLVGMINTSDDGVAVVVDGGSLLSSMGCIRLAGIVNSGSGVSAEEFTNDLETRTGGLGRLDSCGCAPG